MVDPLVRFEANKSIGGDAGVAPAEVPVDRLAALIFADNFHFEVALAHEADDLVLGVCGVEDESAFFLGGVAGRALASSAGREAAKVVVVAHDSGNVGD